MTIFQAKCDYAECTCDALTRPCPTCCRPEAAPTTPTAPTNARPRASASANAAAASGQSRAYVLDYSELGGQPYTVGFTRRAITVNGKPTLLQSGSIHYPRSTPGMWPKLMAEARAAGLNTIQSYVFWNYHQRELHDYTEGKYDYTERGNVTAFLQAAKDANLFVIWRFGPYICAEWPSGGMPSWLNQVKGDKPRSANPVWMEVATKWATDHFDLIKPYLAINGGPVIMSQMENEFGCSASDPGCTAYLGFLGDLAKKLDTGVIWEMCHGSVAPGMIGAGNGCGGPAGGCIAPPQGAPWGAGRACNSYAAFPASVGNFSDRDTWPLMTTEDEQWFDYQVTKPGMFSAAPHGTTAPFLVGCSRRDIATQRSTAHCWQSQTPCRVDLSVACRGDGDTRCHCVQTRKEQRH